MTERFGTASLYRDRTDAGQRLAAKLTHLVRLAPVILALPRGGVPVAVEVAAALHASLDLVFVRKIGMPGDPEVAVAAVVDGDHPQVARNDDALRMVANPDAYLAAQVAEKLAEIERRRVLYVGDRPRVDIAGRTVILVDDGIATGTTALAAIKAVEDKMPAHAVLAVPVASTRALRQLETHVDEVVCLHSTTVFEGVGAYYEDFRQVDDADVVACMQETRQDEGACRF